MVTRGRKKVLICGQVTCLFTCFDCKRGTNTVVTKIIITFVAMPWPVVSWVVVRRLTVVTTPATVFMWMDIMRVNSEQWVLV